MPVAKLSMKSHRSGQPFKRRRCLIPANGFYEWTKNDKGEKVPMYLHLKDQELFAFAGLWEVWHSPEGVSSSVLHDSDL